MNRDVARRVLIALVVVACIGGLVLAVSRTRSGEEQPVESGDSPGVGGSVIELVVPAEDSHVLRQASIGIDLAPTWVTVALEIGGVNIPEDQWDEEPALNQVFFTPGEGKEIEELEPGRTCARASYRRVDQPSATPRPFTWCFDVD